MTFFKLVVEADSSALASRGKKLWKTFSNRKLLYLWRPIAFRMAQIYRRHFQAGWPDLVMSQPLSPDYVDWKEQRGYSNKMLTMTGRLGKKMSDAGQITNRATNENRLWISIPKATSSRTGQWNKPRPPVNYAHVIAHDFYVKHPYGYKQNRPRVVRGRNFLWRDYWREEINQEAEKFAENAAVQVWGRNRVTKGGGLQ